MAQDETDPDATVAAPQPVSPIANLFPGYFALVLATGIIAIGAEQQNLRLLANTLFGIAALAFLVLFIMTLLRLLLYPKLLFSDLTHHSLGFSFLTLVAAINVLGGCAADIQKWWTVAEFCWGFGLLLLVMLIYSSLFGVILRSEKPPMGTGINGTWFLLTVSLESVAVLGGTLLGHTGPNEGIELVTASAFTLGIVLYLVVVTMLFQRWSFSVLDLADAAQSGAVSGQRVFEYQRGCDGDDSGRKESPGFESRLWAGPQGQNMEGSPRCRPRRKHARGVHATDSLPRGWRGCSGADQRLRTCCATPSCFARVRTTTRTASRHPADLCSDHDNGRVQKLGGTRPSS